MTRYIDADALKEKYGDYYAEEGTEEGFIGTVGQLIDNAPTMGVETDCALKQFGKCNYNESGCSDCFIKERIRRALDEKAYESGHADGARLGYEKGLKEASNYSEGWMEGYNHAIDQIFKELNYLVKSHVLEELRKTVSIKR